ncbi:MAG: disulfide bond formation protein DsbB [Candidatus Thiodiazotropha sp. (ex Dulcina madagascariensis)]|nr:disulfide bond formation protein DsbB [Candidatus Thiodiazotropha sp. (ex Epidulcina cf. delphinae)]MCU7923381.1 disulfide bond formation protein DsbB [Candidatus Thiodiazotropha sp. (ex Dulcina madagascariensis)]MCU7928470.1 disulfide bond formation protein DsbB [Candidatus Thiodiazotropha sp. (ex Dulcina madagascariensis)]
MISHRHMPWLVLAISAVSLESAGLYFQYGLDLDPCVLCVYQRTAVLGIAVAALIGMSAPRFLLVRLIGYAGWGASALWALYLALKLSGMQLGFIAPSLSCDANAKFPAWLKLDQWLPSVFQPTGFCGDIQWQFLGLSMPQWMAIIMAFNLVVLITLLIFEVKNLLTPRYR